MSYEYAKKRYAEYGVDTEKALDVLSNIPISIQCWQADDVRGFERNAKSLSGGIQATGNYPGRARNPKELMDDFSFAISLIPGKKKLNLHASYLSSGRDVDRNKIEPEDYKEWVDYAKREGIGLDFNPTFFSHPMVKDNLTLSSYDKDVRKFWVEHGIRCRKISAYFAKELREDCVCNLWIPDGFKDEPADRLSPRLNLKKSLDEIYSEHLDGVIDCVESKVFGIGLESFTVGSSEFYLSYASRKNGIFPLLDAGHYHPTEEISEKLSALLCFFDKVPLHVTRPVRWDSDHVVRLTDEIKAICHEIVANNAIDRIPIALDYFDASINRIVAWIVGTRNVQKALLMALLEPIEEKKELQRNGKLTRLFALSEEEKGLPWSLVWDEYLRRNNICDGFGWFDKTMEYEKDVLSRR